MNILFISRDYPPYQYGGVGIYIDEMSQLLAGLGHKVFVITEAIEHPLEYVEKDVRVFRIRPERFAVLNPVRKRLRGFLDRLEYSYAVSRKIREIVRHFPVDIIESCEARAEGFWHYLFHRNPPLVIKLHTPEGICNKLNRDPQTLDRRLIEKLEEWWLCRADRLIGLSSSISRLTQDYYRLRLGNIPLAANPINIDIFKPGKAEDERPCILYAGRLEYRKGVQVLIRAVPIVLKKFPQARFVFIGNDCGMKNYLLSVLHRHSLNDSVEFIAQVPRRDMVVYYQQSAVCVVPSLWENHPYTVLEAMACGKPVVAADAGGIPEIITHGVNGILAPPGSVLSLAEAIVELLADPQMRREIGMNARRRVEEVYSPAKVIQRTLDVYQKLVWSRAGSS